MKQSRTHSQVSPRATEVSQSFQSQRFLISEGCVLFPWCFRYKVISGTPEKILEHLLEMMRLDSQFTESGTALPAALTTSDYSHQIHTNTSIVIIAYCEGLSSICAVCLLSLAQMFFSAPTCLLCLQSAARLI